MSDPAVSAPGLVPDDEVFVRMNRAERLQHALLMASFAVLLVTGLPGLAGEGGLAGLVAGRGGASALRGNVHRAAALALVAGLVWHALYTVFSVRGRRNFRDKLPRWRDVKDAVSVFGHNIGLAAFLRRRGLFRGFFERHPFWRFDRRPETGRYGFVEKFEYWSLHWGSAVMVLTGFFLWRSDLSLKVFPLWLHQVFVVAHGYEAVLALVAVVLWHMYTVHLDPRVFPMSRVWLDGKITAAELRRLRPLEYRRILEERERAAAERQGPDPGEAPPGPARG